MKITELLKLTTSELEEKILIFQKELLLLRCNNAVQQLEDTSMIKKTRKKIARAKTVLMELNKK